MGVPVPMGLWKNKSAPRLALKGCSQLLVCEHNRPLLWVQPQLSAAALPQPSCSCAIYSLERPQLHTWTTAMCNPSCSWSAMSGLSLGCIHHQPVSDFGITGALKWDGFSIASSLLWASFGLLPCCQHPAVSWSQRFLSSLPCPGCQINISVYLLSCSQSKQLLSDDLWPQVSCQCMALGFLHLSADPPTFQCSLDAEELLIWKAPPTSSFPHQNPTLPPRLLSLPPYPQMLPTDTSPY